MSSIPTIRSASAEDVPAIRRLMKAEGRELEHSALVPIPGRRHVLVLDAPNGGLAAAAVLALEGKRSHLEQLVIGKEFDGRRLEDRLIAVAEAIGRAFGATTLDIPGHRAA